MIIEILNALGIKLCTKGKICEKDIIVKPVLLDKTVTENGTYTAGKGYVGFSSFTVNVPTETVEEYDGSVTIS